MMPKIISMAFCATLCVTQTSCSTTSPNTLGMLKNFKQSFPFNKTKPCNGSSTSQRDASSDSISLPNDTPQEGEKKGILRFVVTKQSIKEHLPTGTNNVLSTIKQSKGNALANRNSLSLTFKKKNQNQKNRELALSLRRLDNSLNHMQDIIKIKSIYQGGAPTHDYPKPSVPISLESNKKKKESLSAIIKNTNSQVDQSIIWLMELSKNMQEQVHVTNTITHRSVGSQTELDDQILEPAAQKQSNSYKPIPKKRNGFKPTMEDEPDYANIERNKRTVDHPARAPQAESNDQVLEPEAKKQSNGKPIPKKRSDSKPAIENSPHCSNVKEENDSSLSLFHEKKKQKKEGNGKVDHPVPASQNQTRKTDFDFSQVDKIVRDLMAGWSADGRE